MAKTNLTVPSVRTQNIPPIALILLIALALRLAGIGFGLPHLYHADEPIVVNHALAYGTGDLNPHFFKIPPLVSYFLFVVYGLFYVVGHALKWFNSTAAFETFFYSNPAPFYLLARILFGALTGTASVYFLCRLGRRHFSETVGLLAALFFSVCFLHVRDSHYIYTDIPLCLVMICAFSAILERFDRTETTFLDIRCGALIGLAAAVKYNGAALLLPYVYAVFFSKGSNKIRSLVTAALALFFTFALLNPFSILDFRFFINELQTQAQSNTGAGWLHPLLYSLAGGMTTILVPALFGLFNFRLYNLKKATLAVFILGYYLILVKAAQPYDRYVLPLIPFLTIFAASYVEFHCKKHKKRMVLVLAAILILPVLQDFALVRILSTPDTRTAAEHWIEKNIPTGSKLALGWDFLSPRLRFANEQLQEKLLRVTSAGYSASQKRRLDHLLKAAPDTTSYHLYFLNEYPESNRFLFASPVLAYDFEQLRKLGIDYVILPASNRSEFKAASQARSFVERLEGEADLVAVFSPYYDGRFVPIDDQPLTGAPFLPADLFARKSNGQPIRIFRLNWSDKRLT